MHASTNLSKILKRHGWGCCPKEREKIVEPIHPNSIKELESSTGPESKAECKQLEVNEVQHLRNAITMQSSVYSVISDKQRNGDSSTGDKNPTTSCPKENTCDDH
eukprot:4024927-Ditylum_brightwellii.AAC.2